MCPVTLPGQWYLEEAVLKCYWQPFSKAHILTRTCRDQDPLM